MFICTKHYFPKMVLSGFGRQLWIIKGCLCRLLLTYFSLPQDFAPAAGSSSPQAHHQSFSGRESAAESNSPVSDLAEHLLDTYGNSILRLAYSYLHNMSDAEDILQETLIRFLETVPSFASDAHEKAWLLKVAANLSKNRMDYNHIRHTDELDETLAAEEREDLSFVWEAVKALPPQYRSAIHLFYQEGYPTAQIAQILGRRESSVRSDLRRGRERLKLILKEEYDFE